MELKDMVDLLHIYDATEDIEQIANDLSGGSNFGHGYDDGIVGKLTRVRDIIYRNSPIYDEFEDFETQPLGKVLNARGMAYEERAKIILGLDEPKTNQRTKYDAIVGFPGKFIVAVSIMQKLEYRRAGNDAAGEGKPLRPQLVGEGKHQITARGFAHQNDILGRKGFQQILITGLAIAERINALVLGTEPVVHRKNIISPMLDHIGDESKRFLCRAFPKPTAMDIIKNFV